MKDAIKASLDATFQRNTASIDATAKSRRTREHTEDDFLLDFMEAQNKFIQPAMQEIGQYIKGKGYDFEVSADDDEAPTEGRGSTIPASVTFTLFLGPRSYRKDEHPSLSVICDKDQQLVRFHECTHSTLPGGYSRSAGEEKLPAVTRELIQQKIAALVAEVLGRDASARDSRLA